MKIAFITSGYLPVPPTKGGAVENLVYNLIKENEKQDKNKFVVYSIFDENDFNFRNTEIKKIKVSWIVKVLDLISYSIAKYILKKDHLISYRYFFQRMSFFDHVAKDISKNSFDRIILENNVVMFRALKKYGNDKKYLTKTFYHAHNELGKTLGYEIYLNKIKGIITVSDYIKNRYRQYITNKEVRMSTVHNIVDQELFLNDLSPTDIDKLKNKCGIENDDMVILFTGRLSREKGILELIKALSITNKENYNLVIVGKAFYDTNIKDEYEISLIEETKRLKGKIYFTGYVQYEEMYKYYQMADVCVLPSIWDEPCALTVIECITSGIPLITTSTGGTPENTCESTILLNAENVVEELAQVLDDLLDNPDKVEEWKRKAQINRRKFGTLHDYYDKFTNTLL